MQSTMLRLETEWETTDVNKRVMNLNSLNMWIEKELSNLSGASEICCKAVAVIHDRDNLEASAYLCIIIQAIGMN